MTYFSIRDGQKGHNRIHLCESCYEDLICDYGYGYVSDNFDPKELLNNSSCSVCKEITL